MNIQQMLANSSENGEADHLPIDSADHSDHSEISANNQLPSAAHSSFSCSFQITAEGQGSSLSAKRLSVSALGAIPLMTQSRLLSTIHSIDTMDFPAQLQWLKPVIPASKFRAISSMRKF